MADTTVDSAVHSQTDQHTFSWGPYWISTTTGAIIQTIASGSKPQVRITTDGGATWTAFSSPQDFGTNTAAKMSCWFDQETPGDSGTLVHVAWMEDVAGDVMYRTVDVSDGTLGTLRTVDATNTIDSAGSFNRIAISKARDGTLMVAYETQVEFECYTSGDSGATWDAKADPHEGASLEDDLLLFPANIDDGDMAGIFWDRSAGVISVKIFDASADSWAEKTILSSMTAGFSNIQMDAALRHSDGFIVCSAHSAHDTTGDDLVTFTVNPNHLTDPPVVTSTANVFTNQAESATVSVFINQQNDDVYIAYLKGGTWAATVDCVYHISTDDMASWGSEQAYSEAAADDLRRVQAGRTVGNDGGLYQPVFFNDDLNDLFVNLVNDVAIAAAVSGVATVDNLFINQAVNRAATY